MTHISSIELEFKIFINITIVSYNSDGHNWEASKSLLLISAQQEHY